MNPHGQDTGSSIRRAMVLEMELTHLGRRKRVTLLVFKEKCITTIRDFFR
jgi:hypothetical protein